MRSLLPFLITGLATGSIYALGAVGLVLTYNTARIFNFAYGALATVGAYVFYWLHVQLRMPWPLAAVIAVPLIGVVLGVAFEPFARILARRSLADQVVATVGLLIAVQAICIIIYGQDARLFPHFLPTTGFTVFGASVSLTDIVTVSLGLIATASLYVFFRRARAGVAMRAVVDNAELVTLAGTNPERVRRWAWIIGCIFATASGVLLAPSLELDASTLSLLVVDSFGAAAIGAFTSLPMSYAGGLLIGVAGAVCDKFAGTSQSLLSGVAPSLPFIALFVVAIVMPKRRSLIAVAHRMSTKRQAWSLPGRLQFVVGALVLVFFAAVPTFAGSDIGNWTQALVYILLILSLGLLVRSAGQVSLCQVTFAAIGAAVFGHLLSALPGIPWGIAILLSGLVAMPVGALLAIPSIRLGGLYLALATFGFGILVQQMFYTNSVMFGITGLREPAPNVGALASPAHLYYVVLGIVLIGALAVVWATRSRLGRLLGALAESPLSLSTNGANIALTRVVVFSLSAGIAGIAGALWGVNVTLASATLFNPITSLQLLALSFIAVGAAPWFALTAGCLTILVPTYVSGGNVPHYLQVFFGVAALMTALGGRSPSARRLKEFLDRIGRPRGDRGVVPDTLLPGAAHQSRPSGRDEGGAVSDPQLVVVDLEVRFGGLVAVDGMSLVAAAGSITSLIGPNGAGKTTLFNACCGLLNPTRGTVLFAGQRLTGLSPAARARLGIGRTFQQIQLSESLTVERNVQVALEAHDAGANVLHHLMSTRRKATEIGQKVATALAFCGITSLAGAPVDELSTGQRRLVELARCLAGPYELLLLDEPSSGLDQVETERLGDVLRRAVSERGVGILLVEHDMGLVMDLSDRIYVMDFGHGIFDGAPEAVQASPVVRSAYLGAQHGTTASALR